MREVRWWSPRSLSSSAEGFRFPPSANSALTFPLILVVSVMFPRLDVLADDSLRQAVIDALISHEAAVRSGHWIGEVSISLGCKDKVFREESSGSLELLWNDESQWGKFRFTEVDRYGPVPNTYVNDREFFVHKGTVATLRMPANAIDVAPNKRSSHVDRTARMRPDEVWYLYEGHYRWAKVLAVPSDFPEIDVVKSEARRTSNGRIHIRQEFSSGVKFDLEADENQGLNLVKWERRWNDWWHSGKANWKQTDTGVWYPESIEYLSATPPCLHLPKKFSLKTSSFEANPKIDPRRFEWRANVPDGTKFSILGDRGQTIREGMIGRREVEKPEELLNRLGDDAREGFPSPNKK